MRALCHRSPVERRYYSGACSLSFAVSVLLSALVVVLPLLLAHGSRDFAAQTNTYREKPLVAFTYQCVCVLEGERVGAAGEQRAPFSLVQTTLSPRINHILQANSRASHFKHYSRDTDGDGVSDALHVDITVPLLANESVHRATVVVLLNYTLESYIKLNMDALAMYTHESAVPGESLFVDGDMMLQMRRPLVVIKSPQTPYATSPLLNLSAIQAPQDLQLESVVARYRDRDYTALFEAQYPVWRADSSTNARTHTQRRFQVQMTMRIPTSDVLYHPAWSEVLKKAWIQYYCILVIIAALAMRVREYLFQSNLLSSVSAVNDPHLRRILATNKRD